MATQPKKMNIIKQVLIGNKNGMSVRELAGMYSISPTTVQRYLKMAKEDKLDIDTLVSLDDPELNHRFNGGNPAYCDERFEDFKKRIPHFEQEMKHKHMTVQLLWEEYRKDVPNGYSLTQFRYHLNQNSAAAKPSTVLKMLHQPGAKMYVDFAGDKLSYVDKETGEEIIVETFAAVLPCSGYTFITCVPSQGIEHFLGAVDAAIRFFGGAPRMIVPDNLRSAVKSFDRWSPGITDGLNDLATHYGCVALPTRAGKPKDKALVEDAVHKSYKRIYAPLRNRIFHSLEELNEAIMELLKKYNSRRMQGCNYSRVERFHAVEYPELLPLPTKRYQMKRTAMLKVAPNCFIQLGTERHHYSVPYRLIGQRVEVVFTASQVRIFHDGVCVATHRREMSHSGYTYEKIHLPSQTQAFYEYSAQYFIDRGKKYGSEVEYVLRELFSDATKPAEIFYRSAQGILSLARETDPELFSLSCKLAAKYNKCNYSFINNLIKSKCRGVIMTENANLGNENYSPSSHENIRGPQAYQ